MDGVVADFVGGMYRSLGLDAEERQASWPPGDYWHLSVSLGWSLGQYRRRLRRLDASFWSSLEEYPGARDFYAWLRQRADVFFLTAPPSGAASWGKERWLRAWTGDPGFDRYVMTRHKHLCAAPHALLIDDSDENVDSFLGRAQEDGVPAGAILCPRIWNRRHAERHDAYAAVQLDVEEWLREHGLDISPAPA
jgi:hypothetical protein